MVMMEDKKTKNRNWRLPETYLTSGLRPINRTRNYDELKLRPPTSSPLPSLEGIFCLFVYSQANGNY